MNRAFGLRLCLLVCLWTLASCSGGGGSADEGNNVPGGGSDVQLDTSLDVVGIDAQNDHSQDGEPSPDQANDHVSTELSPDETPPTVNIIEPKDGAQVSDSVLIEVEADDDREMDKIELYVDGGLLTTLTTEPYEHEWDLTGLISGNYLLTAVAYDEAGNSAEDSIVVFVLGECDEDGTCPPKSINIITPADGADVCGETTIEATATADNGIAEMEFFVNEDSLGVAVESPYTKKWDTTDYDNGEFVVKVIVTDLLGYEAFASIKVIVKNEGENCDNDPSIVIIEPEDGAYVDGLVNIVADATDDDIVLKVQFSVDNQGLGVPDTMFPWEAEWDTSEIEEGAHSIKAKAYDTADQTADAQIQVTVDRTAPEVELVSPETGIPYHDTVPFEVEATDNFKVDRVEISIEGDEPEILFEWPYLFDLDATDLASGTYEFEVVAYDGAEHTANETGEFLLDRPPIVIFEAPGNGSTVFGDVSIQVSAEDDLGIWNVGLYIDGDWVDDLDSDGGNLYQYNWKTPYQMADHQLKVVVEDGSDQQSEAEIQVTVDHPVEVDLLLCSVESCEPLVDDAEVSGVLNFEADATDDGSEIVGVEFHVNGNLAQVDDTEPFEFEWDSSQVTDGTATIKAVAVNELAETGEDLVDIIVNNCDIDGDGYLDQGCEGTDCNDGNPDVNPSEYDGVGNQIDENCDGIDGMDVDADGYASEASGGDDCDDGNGSVNPCGEDLPDDDEDGNCDGEDTLSCDDCDACTADVYEDGECQHSPIGEGQACDDGDPCTNEEVCIAGICGGGGMEDCDDWNLCTLDSCDPFEGCIYVADPTQSGQPCADGVCFAGTCCQPACAGKECGNDGCGGSCGGCENGFVCEDGSCEPLPCWPNCSEEVLIPAGSFMMGCNEAVDDDCYDSEYPYHEVTLYEYYIDVTEVTQGDFNVCVGAGVCNTSWNPDCTWDPNGMPEHPVTCVDWHNAKTYCEWLGKRLPTEAEWEKAARGTDGRKYPWGNEDATCDYAVIENDGGVNGCGTGGFLPVCSKSPAGDSPYGLCDMLGNVSEWVADWKDNNYYYVSPANNPLGPFSAMYRGVRGCSYSSLAAWCRVSRRGSLWPGDIKYHMGFRCARSAAECPAGQNCTGLECGSDPVCGESCGNCSGYEVCDQGQCVESGGLVWIPIPGGTFIMGCSPGDEDCDIDEYPPHEVTVSSFEMLETEVTEIQYWSVAGENPSCLFGFDGPHTPVECIDWYEAKAFCEALGGGRLCTEAEWEYAARGGTTTKYYCGDDSSCLDDIAWWWSNSSYGPQFGRQKHEVKGKEPNDYGLYDMLGNVAEWVEDCWHNDYDLNDDGEGDWDVGYPAWMADCSSGSRVVRGSYFLAFASHLRMSHRGGNEPSFASQGAVGFRCCKSE